MIDFAELDRRLRESAQDRRLDHREKAELRELGKQLDGERIRSLRNRAFDMARELVGQAPGETLDALRWLEQVVKTLDAAGASSTIASSAHFAPGDPCLRKLVELCRSTRRSVDACVFTIADDRLSRELLACHQRGVAVRIVTDDDKAFDDGSDVRELRELGVPLRIDDSAFHMHHKFALFDGRVLANGSFNWTRSATVNNEENLVVTNDPRLVRSFAGQFDALWEKFAHTAAPPRRPGAT